MLVQLAPAVFVQVAPSLVEMAPIYIEELGAGVRRRGGTSTRRPSLEARPFFDNSNHKEAGSMAKMNTQAWDIVDSLDRLRADFIRDFIRNGEPADLKESLTEFTD